MSPKTPENSAIPAEYAKNHFALNRWILKYAGLWKPDTKSKILLFLFRVYAIIVFLFVNLWFTSTEFISIKDTKHDWELLIKNINFALTHMMGAFKCVFWFLRGDKLIGIILRLEDERWHYEDSTDFYPGAITQDAKRTGIKYTFAFFMLAHMTLSSSYIPAFFTAIFNPTYVEIDVDSINNQSNLTFDMRLPYLSWVPFEYNTPKRYIIAILYQAGPMWSYAYSIVGMDTLFMNIMNYIAAHLLILNGAFRTLRERCVQRVANRQNGEILARDIETAEGLYNSQKLNEEMRKEMKKCVQHLQTVINSCEELEFNHNYLTLGQILATLFILCTSLFLVSTTPVGSSKFAAEGVYMIAMGFQLVLYCWFGNKVTERASDLPHAIWHGDWLQATQSFKKSMLITMIRMKKPLYLTVGKFAPLTLTTFVAILKASYSFFAVLKKVND